MCESCCYEKFFFLLLLGYRTRVQAEFLSGSIGLHALWVFLPAGLSFEKAVNKLLSQVVETRAPWKGTMSCSFQGRHFFGLGKDDRGIVRKSRRQSATVNPLGMMDGDCLTPQVTLADKSHLIHDGELCFPWLVL